MSNLSEWKKESKKDINNKVILFVISPFLSFLYSLKTINTKSSFAFIFLFYICFGMAFSVSNIREHGDGSIDGGSYRYKFEEYCRTSATYYYSELEDYLSFDGNNKDFYFDTVAFYLSRVTDNYHVMFFIFSIVFAFFQLKCLKYLVLNRDFQISTLCMLLVLLFTWNQIFNINGMRFWTAAWIGVYCIFKIFYENKNRYFLLAILTTFFHGSFWIFFAMMIVAKLFSRFEKAWIILFIISVITSNILLEIIHGFSGYLPSFLQNSFETYTDSSYIKGLSQGSGFYWVDQIFKIISRLYINILVVMFIFSKNKKWLDVNEYKLYSFLLVWMTFCNFGLAIPTLGGRFLQLSYPIIAFLWLSFFKRMQYNRFIYFLPIAFFMLIYHQLGHYALVTDFFFYVSSPFILIPQYLF